MRGVCFSRAFHCLKPPAPSLCLDATERNGICVYITVCVCVYVCVSKVYLLRSYHALRCQLLDFIQLLPLRRKHQAKKTSEALNDWQLPCTLLIASLF